MLRWLAPLRLRNKPSPSVLGEGKEGAVAVGFEPPLHARNKNHVSADVFFKNLNFSLKAPGKRVARPTAGRATPPVGTNRAP